MPAARKELLNSSTSYARSGENRLTEIFATVLDAHEGLVRALMERVGLPKADSFEVRTQERVAPGCIPDLVVRGKRRSGGLVAQLWAEHKTVSGFRHEQREDYLRALEAAPGVGRLLTITVDPVEGSGAWQRLTWQEVGELVDLVGRSTGGDAWRRQALAPAAPARDRLLHELLFYFEREGFAVVRPLTTEDVSVFSALPKTLEVLEAFANRAAERIGDYIDDSLDADDGAFWFHIAPPAEAWIPRDDTLEAYCEVLVATSDDWASERLGEPAVGAGYTLDRKLYEPLSADDKWLDQLEAAEFVFDEWAGYARCWRTRALTDFVEAGETLDVQARALATWARSAIEELSSIRPAATTWSTGR